MTVRSCPSSILPPEDCYKLFRVIGADGFTRRIEAEKKQNAGGHLNVVIEQLAERLCAARVQVREILKVK